MARETVDISINTMYNPMYENQNPTKAGISVHDPTTPCQGNQPARYSYIKNRERTYDADCSGSNQDCTGTAHKSRIPVGIGQEQHIAYLLRFLGVKADSGIDISGNHNIPYATGLAFNRGNSLVDTLSFLSPKSLFLKWGTSFQFGDGTDTPKSYQRGTT